MHIRVRLPLLLARCVRQHIYKYCVITVNFCIFFVTTCRKGCYSVCAFVVIVDTSVEVGEKLAEGKTKVICKVKDASGMVVIRSKDRITAGDGARAHDMAGKSVISTSTNCSVFELLNKAGATASLCLIAVSISCIYSSLT